MSRFLLLFLVYFVLFVVLSSSFSSLLLLLLFGGGGGGGGGGAGGNIQGAVISVFSTVYLSLQKVQGLLTCEAARLHIISRNLQAAAPHQRDILTSVCIILLCPYSGCQCLGIFVGSTDLSVLMYVLMH